MISDMHSSDVVLGLGPWLCIVQGLHPQGQAHIGQRTKILSLRTTKDYKAKKHRDAGCRELYGTHANGVMNRERRNDICL